MQLNLLPTKPYSFENINYIGLSSVENQQNARLYDKNMNYTKHKDQYCSPLHGFNDVGFLRGFFDNNLKIMGDDSIQ